MNVYDSDRMRDSLAKEGFEIVDNFKGANLVILNTCHIREKATDKVYSELGAIRKEKDKMAKAGTPMIIAVAGCVAQAEGDEIIKRAPFVDLVVGPQSYQRLPEMINNITGGNDNNKKTDLDFSTEDKFDKLPQEFAEKVPSSAFLTIQEGCDKFCTFCVVPYTRGAEFSRSVPEIRREAMRFVEAGAREISLLGQNVNAYHGSNGHGKEVGLGDLMLTLAEIKGLERIRYSTSHPRDMHDALVEAHKHPKIMPFLHLPVQSGSDKVLNEMNRKHTKAEYKVWIDKLIEARPDIAFSSDFIVGFPGETDEDFEETLELVDYVKYANCYSFKYSARPGTPAANREDTVSEDLKDARLKKLQTTLRGHQTGFNQSCEGMEFDVLFEKIGRETGQIIGKSPYMQSVHAIGSQSLIGNIARVKVTGTKPNSLEAIII